MSAIGGHTCPSISLRTGMSAADRNVCPTIDLLKLLRDFVRNSVKRPRRGCRGGNKEEEPGLATRLLVFLGMYTAIRSR